MQIAMIEGATRIIGKEQGFKGLPLRDELINTSVTGDGTPSMVSAWTPSPAELARLVAGASVHLRIIGTVHPPVSIDVGMPPPEK